MTEFNEEEYKKNNDYDILYDRYISDFWDLINKDPDNILSSPIVGDLKGADNWDDFKDNRSLNKPVSIDLNNAWKSFYQRAIPPMQKALDEIKKNANSYASYETDSFIDVEVFWNNMQCAKANDAAPTNEAGKIIDSSKGGNAMDELKPSDTSVKTTNSSNNEDSVADQQAAELMKKMYESWDPRFQRLDCFFLKDGDEKSAQGAASRATVRVPFSSFTIASAFSDETWTIEAGMADMLLSDQGLGKDPAKALNIGFYNLLKGKSDKILKGMNKFNKVIMNDTKSIMANDRVYGTQSIVNPYSLTKLMGGIEYSELGAMNYMYDIRDRRRFYGISVLGDDVLAVDNPTVTLLIEYGNHDAWGRTPYSFQDFVYCKFFGIIPNNRLLTLRRYHAPTYDNLQFETMYGKVSDAKEGMPKENVLGKVFSPHASVVTWFGGDTENSLSSIMNFTTGIKWEDAKSDIWTVNGNEGESKQAVIDRLLGEGGEHTPLYTNGVSPEFDKIRNFLEAGSTVTAKFDSLGKFVIGLTGEVGMDKAAYSKTSAALVDPYESTLHNRVKGPINRIDSVKKRAAGIEFSQTLTVKCSYKSKAIGGINPKAALLDVLGNCLEMVSPHAVFWGGGHRFMIEPEMYPWHDGGIRDSALAKIYDGNFLGEDGAVSTVLKGIKKVGTDSNGNFSMDTVKSSLSGIAGDALAMVGAAINSIASMFGGSDILGGLADMATGLATGNMSDEEKAALKAKATERVNNMFGNISLLWHNKMMAETMQPKIEGMKGLLIGEPVGEWHLTVGNPLNPIMVIGNLICSKAEFKWDEELGPDNFPTGFEVTYSLEHGMARDSDAIQSMFNRGMGKFYTLPDYMSTASDRMTHVDNYTADGGTGDVGVLPYKSYGYMINDIKDSVGGIAQYKMQISQGKIPSNAGNADTLLVTKFTPLNTLPLHKISVNNIRTGNVGGTTAIIRSLAATRKKLQG